MQVVEDHATSSAWTAERHLVSECITGFCRRILPEEACFKIANALQSMWKRNNGTVQEAFALRFIFTAPEQREVHSHVCPHLPDLLLSSTAPHRASTLSKRRHQQHLGFLLWTFQQCQSSNMTGLTLESGPAPRSSLQVAVDAALVVRRKMSPCQMSG